jgi:hypothetical protein
MAAAALTCSDSPECDAQASAISASVSPSLPAMPVSTSGIACNALTAERGNDPAFDVAERERARALRVDHRDGPAVPGIRPATHA